MFWRLQPADYEEAFRQRSLESRSGGPNKEAMRRLIAGGSVPGLLAYRDGRAVGWASVSPRADLVRLEYSPQLRSADGDGDERTWAVSCFYVDRSDWRSGVGTALLAAAVERATAHGASTVEGYPVKAPSVDPYTGYDAMFARAGFRLVLPGRGRGRALWRKDVE
jgi:GNAT superfamily N-acetyltransferase